MRFARSKPLFVLGLILLMIPSAVFLWRNSDLPQFGYMHDDSLYYVSAKSLAEGHYRIESLPGKPEQTKYPPLYPLILSIAWRIDPHFPQNLPVAGWLSWLAVPILLVLLSAYYPRIGIEGGRMWLLLILLAINPYVIWFSSMLLSELWFTVFLVLALLLVERAAIPTAGIRWAIAAGVIGGLAYLARSAGIVLLGSAILYFWMNRQRRKAVWFALAMLPFIACWMLWARLHQLHTSDEALVYYTDYVRYEFYIISLRNLHLVLWKNIDGLLWGLGSLMIPKVTDSLPVKILTELAAVAMISGIVRMFRSRKARHYTIFAAGSAFLLIIWHFPPNERFVLPLAPLALAGLLTEMEHFFNMTRAALTHRDRSQRVAAVVMASAVGLGLSGSLALQAYVSGDFLENVDRQQRALNSDYSGAYAWMRANLPSDAAVVAYNDPVLFLYTGHTAISRPLPPVIWYTEDYDSAVELYEQLVPYAHQHGAQYIYFTTADMHRDMNQSRAGVIEQAIRSNPKLTPVYEKGTSTIYRTE